MKEPVPIVAKDGTIDWRAGVYKVNFEGAKAVTIEHRPTGDIVDIDDAYHTNNTWSLRNNFDDLGAQLWRTKAQQFNCKDFFTAGKSPYKVPLVKGAGEALEVLAIAAAAKLKEEDSKGKVLEQAKHDYRSPVTKAKAEGTKRAREALLRKADEVDARRRARLA